MTRYANRTCYHCGAIHPQNQMFRQLIKTESGSSKNTRSAWTVLADSNKKRARDTLLGLNSRTYYRNKEVWSCQACHDSESENSKFGTYEYIIIFAIIYAIFSWFSSGNDDDAKTLAVSTTYTDNTYSIHVDTSKLIEVSQYRSLVPVADGGYAIVDQQLRANIGVINLKCATKDTVDYLHHEWHPVLKNLGIADSYFYNVCE